MTNEIERALNELAGNVDDLLESLCPDYRYDHIDGGHHCPECPMVRGTDNTECNPIDQRRLITDLRGEIERWYDNVVQVAARPLCSCTTEEDDD